MSEIAGQLHAQGYAPGDYYCTCLKCGKVHIADKLATRCLECATARAEARVFNEANPTEADDLASRDADIARLRGVLLGAPDTPEAISPLSWLRSAIVELKGRGPERDDDDPDAYWMMVRELEALEKSAREALEFKP